MRANIFQQYFGDKIKIKKDFHITDHSKKLTTNSIFLLGRAFTLTEMILLMTILLRRLNLYLAQKELGSKAIILFMFQI